MTRRLWLAISTGVALCCALSACQRNGGVAPPANPGQQNAPQSAAATVFTGTASCSGRSCHGGLEAHADQTRIGQNEYSKWLTDDLHANAFQVLLQPRTKDSPDPKAIAAKLNIKEPHKSALCLNCHMTPYASADASDSKKASGFAAQKSLALTETVFGVGCESCHGRAEKWISAHTSAIWPKNEREKFEKYDFVAYRNIKELAKTCVGCHVGAPPEPDKKLPLARDVNHDLIAAGHPRLNFELDVFLDNLPPHWNTKAKEARDGKDIHARTWAHGQLASAETALVLLAYRADEKSRTNDDRPTVWPEFAEYDCFACHHDLLGESWRQKPGYAAGRRRGSLPWGTWYFTMPGLLGDESPAADKNLRASLDELGKTMGAALLSRAEVLERIANARKAVGAKAAAMTSWDTDRQAARERLQALGSDPRWQSTPSWDSAMQTALAAHSLNLSQGVKSVKEALAALEIDLAFHKPYASPHAFTPSNIDKLREALLKVKD